MIDLTYDRAVQLLEQAVEVFGEDHVYSPRDGGTTPWCKYVHEGRPDCIVGNVLAAAGVPIWRLEAADSFPNNPTAGELVAQLAAEEFLAPLDERTPYLLDVVQDRQDAGTPWGEAVDDAIAVSA